MFPDDDQMKEGDVLAAMVRLAERASEPQQEAPDDATQRDSGWWFEGEKVEELRNLRRNKRSA